MRCKNTSLKLNVKRLKAKYYIRLPKFNKVIGNASAKFICFGLTY